MRPVDDPADDPAGARSELPDDPDLDRLLARLDHPAPEVSAREIIARARARRPGRLPWAAAIVLALGVAGAAYAAPGSPVPGWIEAVARTLGFAPSSTPSAPAPEPYAAGIAVTPGDSLVIRFAGAPAAVGGYARISLTDESEVTVASPTPSTRFITEPTTLVIEHRTSDTLRIAIPRSSRHVEIEVEGRTVLLLEAGRATGTERPADSDGTYLVRLTP